MVLTLNDKAEIFFNDIGEFIIINVKDFSSLLPHFQFDYKSKMSTSALKFSSTQM